LGFFLAATIHSHKKPPEQRSREARHLSNPRLSITAAILLHRDSSGRDAERLADVGGVVDFVARFILIRLMNPSAIITVKVSGQLGQQLAAVIVGSQVNVLISVKCQRLSINTLSIQRPLPSMLMRTPAAVSRSAHAFVMGIYRRQCLAIRRVDQLTADKTLSSDA